MPKVKTVAEKKKTASTAANKQKGRKKCTCCKMEKNLIDFYLSYSPMYQIDQRIPVCKDCCKSSVLNEDGTINYPKFRLLLMNTDKPLYFDLIKSSADSVKNENSYMKEDEIESYGKDILQKYYTLISMRQDRAKCYADSENDDFMHQNNNRTENEKKEILTKYYPLFFPNSEKAITTSVGDETELSVDEVEKKIRKTKDVKFEVTDEMIDLFGDGYTPSVYKKMYEKYQKLKLNYSIQTNLHEEALATYVRFKVKEEIATAKGDVTEAQKWYNAAQDAADKAKLTPKQLTQADLQGGINSFSEIFKAVEQAVDVIPILPRFKSRPNDALDFNIWCYINYARDLQGLPQCEYRDVYKFYDKKKQEYIDQYGDPYGIFDEDVSEHNRPSISKFVTLPKDYMDEEE